MGMEKYCDRCGKKLGGKKSAPLSISFRDTAIDYEDVCEDCTNAVYRGLERALLISLPAVGETAEAQKATTISQKTNASGSCSVKSAGGLTKAEDLRS